MGHKNSTATTEEKYLRNSKNCDMVDLYKKLRAAIMDGFGDVITAATADYISWKINGGRQFANFYIQKKKIRILTVKPLKKYDLGECVPDTHLWTLNYQTDIFSEEDIDVAKNIIVDSHNQLD